MNWDSKSSVTVENLYDFNTGEWHFNSLILGARLICPLQTLEKFMNIHNNRVCIEMFQTVSMVMI